MAIYDRSEDRIIVRVIYDGLGNAGKTTNLQQLCKFFTLRRRSELYVPEERAGRTLYFDWLQLESGLVGGYRLRCQVLSVPGQFVLRERRARLLKTADVVVLVCDSTPEGVERVRRGLTRTREFMHEHGRGDVRFILQANKQDLPNSLSPEAVAKTLGFQEDVQVVPARAFEAIGVRETVVLALRAAADRVQQQLLQGGLAAIEGEMEEAEALYAEMRRNETCDPETLALAALLDEDDIEIATKAHLLSTDAEPEPAPPEVAPSLAEAPLPSQIPVEAPATPAEIPLGWPEAPRSRSVPSGLLWPTAHARDVLRGLDGLSTTGILDRVAQAGGDGSGKSGLILYRVGDSCFKTNAGRALPDTDRARQALIALVRDKQVLGKRMPEGTLLAVAEDKEQYWLWTVAPWLPTLQSRLSLSAQQHDEPQLAAALCDFALAAVDAIQLFARDRILLDLHPSNFARQGDHVVYLDDEIARDGSVYALLHATLQRVEEYGSFEGAIAQYRTVLEAELAELSPHELRHASVFSHLLELSPRSGPAREFHEHLVQTVKAILAASARTPSIEPGSVRPERASEPARDTDARKEEPFQRVPSFAPRAASERVAPLEVEVTSMESAFPSDAATQDYARPPSAAMNVISDATPTERVPADDTAREKQAPEATPGGSDARPPTPALENELPSGYIWPATKGRELVRRIAHLSPSEVTDNPEGQKRYIGDYVLSTSQRERFDDAEEARAALLARARALVPTLGRDPNDFALMLIPSPDDSSHWLWTIEAATS